MSKKNSGFYNNPNGCMTIERLMELKINGEHIEFMKNFKVTKQPCPPEVLRHLGSAKQCFHCIADCWKPAFDQVKEYRKSWKCGKIKIDK